MQNIYENGILVHKKGLVADHITNGILTSIPIQNGNPVSGVYPFSVDANGYLYAESGTYKGVLDEASGSFIGKHSFSWEDSTTTTNVYVNDTTQDSPIKFVTEYDTLQDECIFDLGPESLRIYLNDSSYITNQYGCTLEMERLCFDTQSKTAHYTLESIELVDSDLSITITPTGIALSDGTTTKYAVFEEQ